LISGTHQPVAQCPTDSGKRISWQSRFVRALMPESLMIGFTRELSPISFSIWSKFYKINLLHAGCRRAEYIFSDLPEVGQYSGISSVFHSIFLDNSFLYSL
jgi:hypothetical protein